MHATCWVRPHSTAAAGTVHIRVRAMARPSAGSEGDRRGGRSHPVALGNRSEESAEPSRFFTDSKLRHRESRG